MGVRSKERAGPRLLRGAQALSDFSLRGAPAGPAWDYENLLTDFTDLVTGYGTWTDAGDHVQVAVAGSSTTGRLCRTRADTYRIPQDKTLHVVQAEMRAPDWKANTTDAKIGVGFIWETVTNTGRPYGVFRGNDWMSVTQDYIAYYGNVLVNDPAFDLTEWQTMRLVWNWDDNTWDVWVGGALIVDAAYWELNEGGNRTVGPSLYGYSAVNGDVYKYRNLKCWSGMVGDEMPAW